MVVHIIHPLFDSQAHKSMQINLINCRLKLDATRKENKCFHSAGSRPEAPVDGPVAARPETVSPNFNRQSLISDNLVVRQDPPLNERAILRAVHDRVESVRNIHQHEPQMGRQGQSLMP